jgi:hypothetical protein
LIYFKGINFMDELMLRYTFYFMEWIGVVAAKGRGGKRNGAGVSVLPNPCH